MIGKYLIESSRGSGEYAIGHVTLQPALSSIFFYAILHSPSLLTSSLHLPSTFPSIS